jgi:uncharacterized protein
MKMFWDKPDLEVRGGSHLYGYATPQSDEDTIGFVVPPREYFVGRKNFEQKVPSKEELAAGIDRTIYGSRKFIDLLLKNETRSLELLFANKENILVLSPIGQMVLDAAPSFVSKMVFRRFQGYARHEWRKVRGMESVPVERTNTEDSVIESMRQVFYPEKAIMDEVIRLLYENREREERPITRNLGAQRKGHIEQYGYSVKNAAHTIRLLNEGVMLLETGRLEFPLPSDMVAMLVHIRAGKSNLEELTKLYNDSMDRLQKAFEKSKLPDKPDVEAAHQLLVRMHKDV